MITVTVCVGSSCHIKGARELITRFSDLLNKEGIEDKVELKGSFCMERCGEGINWKINDEIVSSPSVEDGVRLFRKKICRVLKGSTSQKPGKRTRKKKK
jgi:NADH-quinone oxidoreductase subunit G